MNTEALEQTIQRVIASGPFAETWESLKDYRVPGWYEDGKFGIFIHWGLYSVPAFDNEWYPHNMYLKDPVVYKYHLETYGPQTTFGYKDFLL
jgi:alpha-L-fucosidase